MDSMLPTTPNLRGVQHRHSIVDLSAALRPSVNDDVSTSFAPGGSSATAPTLPPLSQTRRAVASKRRPSGSLRSLRPSNASHSDSTVKLEDQHQSSRPESCPPTAESDNTTGSTAADAAPASPVTYVVLREFQKRCCAIYEPVVTYKALSVLRPLFHRCIEWLEQYQVSLEEPVAEQQLADVLCEARDSLQKGTEIAVISGKGSPSHAPADVKVELPDAGAADTPNVSCPSHSSALLRQELLLLVKNLKDFTSQYHEKMRQLEVQDEKIMRLIRAIEVEHAKLFEYQLQWSSTHATVCETPGVDGTAASSSSSASADETMVTSTADDCKAPASLPQCKVAPWKTVMLKRLETLEAAKRRVSELQKTGTSICSSLDSLISHNLIAVVAAMERFAMLSSSTVPSLSLEERRLLWGDTVVEVQDVIKTQPYGSGCSHQTKAHVASLAESAARSCCAATTTTADVLMEDVSPQMKETTEHVHNHPHSPVLISSDLKPASERTQSTSDSLPSPVTHHPAPDPTPPTTVVLPQFFSPAPFPSTCTSLSLSCQEQQTSQ